MTTPIRLRATLEPFGPACALVLTDDQVAALGGGKRAAVRVTIGQRSCRLRIAVMGGQNVIGLSKASRAELDVQVGDKVTALVELDTAPREVVIPAELAEAFVGDPQVRKIFEAMPYTHRKEYAVWVSEAKKPETRLRRAAQAIQRLRATSG